MRRPGWAASRPVRRWLVVAAVLLLVVAGWFATRSFAVEATLSDGARAFASCQPPWRSARLAPEEQRFPLLAVTGGAGQRRDEAVATLGARCRSEARARLAFAATALAASGVLAWLAFPPRRRPPDAPPGPPAPKPG